MSKGFLKYSLGWGAILWVIGYILGIVLFFIVPASIMGWIIMPIGIIITLLVLFKVVKLDGFAEYIYLGIIWALIAIVLDYLLLVKLFKPEDGYYKLDVYIYYAVTLVLPIVVGWFKTKKT